MKTPQFFLTAFLVCGGLFVQAQDDIFEKYQQRNEEQFERYIQRQHDLNMLEKEKLYLEQLKLRNQKDQNNLQAKPSYKYQNRNHQKRRTFKNKNNSPF